MATVVVRVPGALRQFTGGQATVPIEAPSGAATVSAVLGALAAVHPGVVDRVLDDRGQIRRHVNVFVGPDDVRTLGGLAAPVPDGAELTILPSVSGGAGRVRTRASSGRSSGRRRPRSRPGAR